MTATEIIQVIVDSIIAFVEGISGAFVTAFQNIFMIETAEGVYSGLNALGVFLLVFLGVSLGYGVIRWITGLFRKTAG